MYTLTSSEFQITHDKLSELKRIQRNFPSELNMLDLENVCLKLNLFCLQCESAASQQILIDLIQFLRGFQRRIRQNKKKINTKYNHRVYVTSMRGGVVFYIIHD